MIIGYVILLSSRAFADTIYFKSGSTEKGLIVEEYYDRFILSTPDGEKAVLKSSIDEIFFDEPYRNNLYIGRKFEEEGNFEKAFLFYQLALQSNSDFKEAVDAIKGIEDAKWRFGKSWRYRELKDMLKEQLGIGLKKVKEKIIVSHIERGQFSKGELSPLVVGDVIVSCWAKPLAYAGLKNSSRQLIGLSNTIAKLVIERDITITRKSGLNLFPSLIITMEQEGPVVKSVARDSPFYKSGLREGDLIIKIDGENTRYMKLGELKKRIFGGSRGKAFTIRRVFTLIRMRPENNKTLTAMWAWHSKEVLLNEAKKKELLEFCKKKNIGTLFFQLQGQFIDRYERAKRERSPSLVSPVVYRLLYDKRLRAFLKEAHSQGIKVHGLDGSPDFCLRANHHLILAQVKTILDFNKEADAQERFDGLHYDNEPYLLPAFNSNRREDIINQFLELNQKSKALIATSGAKLEFGIDIPFWFDQLNRLDAKLIDICDNVGIMDYRNFASGPDGIVALALDELKYAAKTKKKVFVGLETSKYPEQAVYFVSMLSEDEFNRKVTDGGLEEFRFEGFLLRAQPYGKEVYLGLVKPKGANEADFTKALSKLEALCGRISKPQAEEDLEKLISEAMFAISSNPEFRDTRPEEYNSGDGAIFLMFIAKEIMLEKLTFADLTEKAINAVLAEAEKEFKNYPSFVGFAIHHYKSYKELCEKQ